ncbi:MAG: UDP-N-acetylmuramate dehydrogenase [Zoogloeaceae bacterium]|nr:UDP-N-acetylmuramate dehydrogenase [Zoogloeaceae bacterium]
MTPLLAHADLQALNTFGLPARARWLAAITGEADLRRVMAMPEWGEPRLVLGGGSNLVLTGDFDGWVLHVAVPGRRLLAQDSEAWWVEAGAGEPWHDFVLWTLAHGWAGLENLALIPGTVGAAPVQNIGAYGLEVAERFAWLEAFDFAAGAVVRIDGAACAFAYRDSLFKREGAGRYLILRVVFRLPKAWRAVTAYADVTKELAAQHVENPTPQDIADAVIAVRRRKLPDPAEIGNAGSFFKNPVVDAATYSRLAADHPGLPSYPQGGGTVKLAAGWLIDQCGWKGRALGPVGTYPNQALVLVNRGGATGADVQRAAQAIQRDVKARFGVELEPEPVFV